jgi:hypothetical protein
MKGLLNSRFLVLLALCLFSCVGLDNSCSSCTAESFGGDWIIVQFDTKGEPFNCWKMSNVSISNEHGSDGIWWKTPSGHLVHISGWYNRVQVRSGDYSSAAKSLGVELDRCSDGRYQK